MKPWCRIIILLFLLATPMITSAYDDAQYARLFVTKKCHKCDLYRAHFAGADLRHFDFTGSNLIQANFQKATLYGADFTNANITGAVFTGAIWIDGSVCQEGSYGKCIKRKEE